MDALRQTINFFGADLVSFGMLQLKAFFNYFGISNVIFTNSVLFCLSSVKMCDKIIFKGMVVEDADYETEDYHYSFF